MFKRLLVYLSEMFPITSFVGTLLTAFSFQLIFLKISGYDIVLSKQMFFSAFVITAVTLLIRVMDEFKDYEDDKVNFPNRPLPSQKVYPFDLKLLGWFCVALVLLLSLTSYSIFVFSLLTLGYTFLMLKWFFIEKRMRKSLPLALVSHHPIVLFNVAYLMLGMVETHSGLTWSYSCYIFPLALIFTNWEISRKIRAPQDETTYTTYSKIWGPRRAALLALIIQIIYSFTTVLIFIKLQSPLWLPIIFSSLMIIFIIPAISFLIRLKMKEPLKISSERQILLVVASLLVASFL